MLQLRDADFIVRFGHADFFAESVQGFRRVAAPTDPGNGRHARIVPAGDDARFHHAAQFPFARDHRRHIETRKLNLPRFLRSFVRLEAPFVERTTLRKFQRADGMRDPLDRVRKRMREIVERINAPRVARAVMRRAQNAINDRVAHDDIRRRHVNLRAETFLAVRVFPVFHLFKKAQIFFDAAIPIRAFRARMRQIAAHRVDFLSRRIVHIRQPHLNQAARKFVELGEIIGRIMHRFLPLETEPFHVFQNGIDVLHLFFGRIRIVKTDIRLPVIFLPQTEIEANALHVPDVQIAVRFRRKTRQHPSVCIDAVFDITIDFRFDKIRGHPFLFHVRLLYRRLLAVSPPYHIKYRRFFRCCSWKHPRSFAP